MSRLFYFLIPFALSLIFTPIVKIVAAQCGLVAQPRADRWHKQPTALLGGVGIYLAALITILFFVRIDRNVAGLLSGGTLLFIVGLLDDKFHFTPYIKLLAQIIAGCIGIFFGIVFGLPAGNLLVIPLTLLWLIGVTNSFNLLDNIDGLSAGISSIAGLLLFFSSLIYSNNSLGVIGLVLAGAAAGFLPYNFHPAKIFMGDSGSMFLGFSLAAVSISGTARLVSNFMLAMVIPVLIMSVPIFDTVFVMIIRKLQGRKVFEGGKDHTSHQLVTLGLSQRKTVILLYAISAVFGLIAILFSRLNIFVVSAAAFLAVIILLFFGLFLYEVAPRSNHSRHSSNPKDMANKTALNSILLHKRRVVEVLLDLALICIAYYSAYFLRFEGKLFSVNAYLIKESLVWIILIKMACFFAFGLYRGLWRYISISDLFTIFKAVSIGSVASILFLTFTFRFQEYSRAVFFIDWLLLLLLISGTRMLFRVLGEFFSRAREKGNNILIFGAGDTGEMVIREIKRNKSLNYNPVGFIDDDPSKAGNKIQGVSVLGSRGIIKELARIHGIKEVIVAIPTINLAELSEIAKICRECGISFRKIKGILDKDEMADFRKN